MEGGRDHGGFAPKEKKKRLSGGCKKFVSVWKIECFSSVTERAATERRQLGSESVPGPDHFSLCVFSRPSIHPWD